MAKLNTMHNLVKRILEESPRARADDGHLYAKVCEEFGVDLNGTSLSILMRPIAERKLPSRETVSRCRRKVQADNPELCDPFTAYYRQGQIEDYKAYARSRT